MTHLLSAKYYIFASKLSIFFASNIVFCCFQVTKQVQKQWSLPAFVLRSQNRYRINKTQPHYRFQQLLMYATRTCHCINQSQREDYAVQASHAWARVTWLFDVGLCICALFTSNRFTLPTVCTLHSTYISWPKFQRLHISIQAVNYTTNIDSGYHQTWLTFMVQNGWTSKHVC